VKKRERLS
jgi:hypothetical protein